LISMTHCRKIMSLYGNVHSKDASDVPQLHMPGAMAWALTKYGVLLDRCSFWFSEDDKATADELGNLFLHMYLSLARDALENKKPRWKIRPKFHSFACELINRKSLVNPRFVGCAGEEDYIGKVCHVAKGALHPATLSRRILERCMLGLNCHLMSLKAKSRAKEAVDVD